MIVMDSFMIFSMVLFHAMKRMPLIAIKYSFLSNDFKNGSFLSISLNYRIINQLIDKSKASNEK